MGASRLPVVSSDPVFPPFSQ